MYKIVSVKQTHHALVKERKKMRKTDTQSTEKPLTYTAEGLKIALGCGRYSAEKIAVEAGARIKIGSRVLYDRRKIEEYLRQRSGV